MLQELHGYKGGHQSNVTFEPCNVVLRRFFAFRVQRGSCLIDNRFECRFVCDGEVCENLAVQRDARSFQSFGQATVSHAVCARGSIETLDPKITKCALARFAVAIRPVLGLHNRVFGVTKKF
jgi:hypothetical protein